MHAARSCRRIHDVYDEFGLTIAFNVATKYINFGYLHVHCLACYFVNAHCFSSSNHSVPVFVNDSASKYMYDVACVSVKF